MSSAPPGCVVASLRRGRESLIPRGATLLHAGDVLVVTVDSPESEQAVRKMVSVARNGRKIVPKALTLHGVYAERSECVQGMPSGRSLLRHHFPFHHRDIGAGL
jgi:hypothetical protein